MNINAPPQGWSADEVRAWLGTEPIPAAPYHDPAYFELERQAVFLRTWLLVGHMSELPQSGSFIVRSVDIANASLLIARGKDGVVRAFHNACPHRGTRLVSEDSGSASAFSCPYHKWTFGNDGAFRSAPDFEKFYVDKADCNLRQVAADVCGGLIYVNFAASPSQSLREFLGPMASQLDSLPAARATTFSEYTYEIAANWKIYCDNFQENYHLRFIHPRTGAAATGADNPQGYPSAYHFYGPHRGNTLWKNPAPPAPAPLQAFALGKARAFGVRDGFPQSHVDFKMFPSLFVIGSASWFFTHMVMPLSVARTRGTIRVYWIGEDDCASRRFAREYVMATLRDVHAEDSGIIEAGQRGLGTGALKHIHFQEHEVLCRHSFRMVDGMVQAYKAEQKAKLG